MSTRSEWLGSGEVAVALGGGGGQPSVAFGVVGGGYGAVSSAGTEGGERVGRSDEAGDARRQSDGPLAQS